LVFDAFWEDLHESSFGGDGAFSEIIAFFRCENRDFAQGFLG
jgi:hypothetical protein